ncbi:MAG TPA: response regulator transcription factor [Bacteroidota bacterium]|jgi:DNA-binding NarL/FixJ family response regulator
MTPPEATTILLADDHPIFRRGLRNLIESDTTLRVIAECEEGRSAMEKIRELRPEVAILDVNMPAMNGMEIARICRDQGLQTRIIFLTMYKEEDMFNAALDAGVLGYVLKENAVGDILQCIRTVKQNKHYISPNISEFLVSRNDRVTAFHDSHPLLDRLTESERRILKLISDNRTSAQIADVLHISEKTVENHRNNICNKLNLHGTHSLVKFAIENKSTL